MSPPEVVIVGAGPAGVSAALWAKALELDVLLLDSAPTPGGQLHAVHFHPSDVPGFEQGHGPELAAAYARQLAAASVPLLTDCLATSIEGGSASRPGPRIGLSTGETIEAAAVLVATGVRRRRLEVPGERELEGRGVSFSATRDRGHLAGRDVVVVGGGDAAFENALLLAGDGCRVTLLVRGVPRARAEFRARVALVSTITSLEQVRVEAILGEAGVEAVRVLTPAGTRELPTEAVVVKIGVIPNSEWCRPGLVLDAEGFVCVDDRLATSGSGVWAAGDITRPHPPSIPVALGQGAQAIAMIREALRSAP